VCLCVCLCVCVCACVCACVFACVCNAFDVSLVYVGLKFIAMPP
jgi:hypothetical protein